MIAFYSLSIILKLADKLQKMWKNLFLKLCVIILKIKFNKLNTYNL